MNFIMLSDWLQFQKPSTKLHVCWHCYLVGMFMKMFLCFFVDQKSKMSGDIFMHKIFWNWSSLKPLHHLKGSVAWIFLIWSFANCLLFFMLIRNWRKWSNGELKKKFSEIKELIECKLYMNNHWILPFKILIFMWNGNTRWLPQEII